MTDLPQLQEALVGAARRRNRRSRARSVAVGLAAVVDSRGGDGDFSTRSDVLKSISKGPRE